MLRIKVHLHKHSADVLLFPKNCIPSFMCTVTSFPGPAGYILTHNRDEAPTRSPMDISRTHHPHAGDLIYPKDTLKSGTWIAAASGGRTVCLLNGAFEKHIREPEYRRSRGLVLLDYFNADDDITFFENYDFNGIEPFTMLVLRPEGHLEFRWDGQTKYLKTLSADEPHFWCSATLYPAAMREKRQQVFQHWMETPAFKTANTTEELAAELLNCHRNGSVNDPENDFVMNRSNRVRTVSITQVITGPDGSSMQYFDLLNGNTASEARL